MPIFMHTFLLIRYYSARTLFSVLLLAACFGCLGCEQKKKEAGPPAMPPVPVEFGQTAQMDVPLVIESVGHVEPPISVQVKSMVAGQIKEVRFREGAFVKENDILFIIDKAPFEAALSQYQAFLARDVSGLVKAKKDLVRYTALDKSQVVSRSDYETALNKAETLEASIDYDQAAIVKAKLDLEYCTIRSPLTGRVGSILIDKGNVIKANDLPLVEIVQIEPINVRFTIPERRFPEARKYKAMQTIEIWADVDADEYPPSKGLLDFIDNKVDKETGVIALKALFENKEHIFWPGQFVNVALSLNVERGRVVAPARAVQVGPRGKYVYVLKPDKTAELRPVVVERVYKDMAVIAEGLAPKETVVVDGHLRVFPSATLVDRAIEQQAAPAAPAKTATPGKP